MQTPSRGVLTVGVAVLLVAVVASAGYVVAFDDRSTELTVENQRDSAYRITAFQNSADSVLDMGFEYTTDAGTRRTGGFDDISNGQGYQRTTLLNAERSTQFTVTAGETTTEALDGWSNGEATVYIVETLDGELLYATGVHCDGGDHTFFLRFRAYGSILSSSQCL